MSACSSCSGAIQTGGGLPIQYGGSSLGALAKAAPALLNAAKPLAAKAIPAMTKFAKSNPELMATAAAAAAGAGSEMLSKRGIRASPADLLRQAQALKQAHAKAGNPEVKRMVEAALVKKLQEISQAKREHLQSGGYLVAMSPQDLKQYHAAKQAQRAYRSLLKQ